jgi:tetratricopeptide (TPR) repeat protein
MAQHPADLNLLYGILALQLDFISRDQLVAALNAWVVEKSQPLGAILVSQQALAPERHTLLQALVQEHLRQHHHDPQRSLAAVNPVGSVRRDLEQLADAEVQASLSRVAVAGPTADDPGATAPHGAGRPTSAGERFRILRPHARGGLGEVFVALDEELHREVALKEILEQHADHPDSRTRFVLEAEITGGLEHPGIVPVYGLGQYADGRPYYAMRFIRGDSLQAACVRFHQADVPGRDPGERALELRLLLGRLIDVCQALQYAHDRGVLHRDLKPGNIMLGKYGETLVVDWGLAKAMGKFDEPGAAATAAEEPTLRPTSASSAGQTLCGSALGTPAYMSPEQAGGRLDLLGPASDVYSLGATLYFLLTGKAAFSKREDSQVLQHVQRGDFPRPRQVKAAVPPALEAICLKAMALAPAHRYVRPRQLADDLEHWLADEPVSAWPEPWRVKTRRWVGRHRTPVTAAAAALVVALVAATVGAVWYQHEQAQRAAEQARLDAEEKQRQAELAVRREYVNKEVGTALTAADDKLRKLRQQIDDPKGVPELLSEPDRWHDRLQAARSDWQQAQKLAAGNEGLLEARWTAELRRLQARLDWEESGYRLAEQLDRVRLRAFTKIEGKLDPRVAAREYPGVFAAAKLEVKDGEEAALAARLRASPARPALVAALDHWATVEEKAALQARVLAVARQADPDPWRDRLREGSVRNNLAQLEELAREVRVEQQSPQVLETLAMLLTEKGGQGAPVLRKAVRHHLRDFWLYFALGYLATDPVEEAGWFQAALAVRPSSGPAHNNLGFALHGRKDLAGAIHHYHIALKLNPKFATAHNNLGIALYDSKDLAGAIHHYRIALELEPKNAKAHNNLGNALSSSKDLPGAIKHLRRAIELEPKFATAHINLGSALRASKDVAGAIKHYRIALGLDSKDALAHYNLGNALFDSQDLTRAIEHYHRALELEPKLAPAHNGLGGALYASKDLPGAIEHYHRALELDSKYVPAHVNLGIALRGSGDLAGAIEHYRIALKLEPKNTKAHNGLGNALTDSKDLAGAIRHYRIALELEPKNALAHFNLGVALSDSQDLPGAIKHYRRALELNPKFAQACYNLGNALIRDGKFSESRDVTREFLKLIPGGDPAQKLAQEQLQLCDQLLAVEARVNAYLDKGDVSKQPRELLEMIELCSTYKHYHATAADLALLLFTKQPALADDLDRGERYQAARSAALAAAGQSREPGKLSDEAQARHRAQALTWLHADLQQWRKRFAARDPKALLGLLTHLPAWQQEPAFAHVRDPRERVKLPPEVQKDWAKLWADVNQFVKDLAAATRTERFPGTLTEQNKEQGHEVKLKAGQTYLIDLESSQFDTFLRLHDSKGKLLAEHDDIVPGVNTNSRVVFTPKEDGTYRLVATAFEQRGTGSYTLTLRFFVDKK